MEQDVDNDEGVFSCSICILELEDGDRIADLDCGHYFHADCLSEWIKKKNSCPLCQAEGIAEEIRSPDVETTSLSHGDSVNEQAVSVAGSCKLKQHNSTIFPKMSLHPGRELHQLLIFNSTGLTAIVPQIARTRNTRMNKLYHSTTLYILTRDQLNIYH
eukprot:scaffold111_cov142-Skeletonema_menzelii.AAC.22